MNAQESLEQARQQLGANQLTEAYHSLLQAVELSPQLIAAWLLLAQLYRLTRQYALAQESYLKVLQIQPEHPEAMQGWFHVAVKQNPDLEMDLVELLAHTGAPENQVQLHSAIALERQQQMEEAHQFYQQALQDPQLPGHALISLRAQLLRPMVAPDKAFIEGYRQKLATLLSDFDWGQPSPIGETYQYLPYCYPLWDNLFSLVYWHLEALSYRLQLMQRFKAWLPPQEPSWQERPLRSGRRRLGVLLGSSIAIYNFDLGLLSQLNPERLEVHLLMVDPTTPHYLSLAELPKHIQVHLLSPDIPTSLQQLNALELDLLYFTEANTILSHLTLFSFYRFAPVQFTCWLSSGSTGQPTMDYYLSSRHLEKPDAQQYYSEKLYTFEHLPSYYRRPPQRHSTIRRSDLTVPDGNWYLCLQSVLKLHPDFDLILGQILEADPQGQLLLLSSPDNAAFRHDMLTRLTQQIPQVMNRICFLPMLSREHYLSLLMLGDVALDPFYFGGGATTYETLWMGTPLITWPAERLHGRITYACYQQIGFLECVAESPQDYVAKAVKVGTDKALRQQYHELLWERAPGLFEDSKVLEEWYYFLENIE